MVILPLVLGTAVPSVALPDTAPLPDEPLAALDPGTPIWEDDAEKDGRWHGSVNVGASKASGNTDTESYSLTVKAKKRWDVHRLTAELGWYLASQDGEQTQRRSISSLKYDRFLNEKTYVWSKGFAETDEEATLDLRWSVGGGVGHQFRDDEEWRISAEAGLVYFNEAFEDSDDDADYLAARAAWDVEKTLSETTLVAHTGEIYPSLDESDDVYGRADTNLETRLTESMVGKLQWIFTWDNTPAQGLDRVDNLYLLTVGWTF